MPQSSGCCRGSLRRTPKVVHNQRVVGPKGKKGNPQTATKVDTTGKRRISKSRTSLQTSRLLGVASGRIQTANPRTSGSLRKEYDSVMQNFMDQQAAATSFTRLDSFFEDSPPPKYLHDIVAELEFEKSQPQGIRRREIVRGPLSMLNIPTAVDTPDHVDDGVVHETDAFIHPSVRKFVSRKSVGLNQDRKEEEQLLQQMAKNQQHNYLANKSHFTHEEVRALLHFFAEITANNKTPGQMYRPLFKHIFSTLFGVTDDILLDQIFSFFDADNEGSIQGTEWVVNLSIILRGNLEEHTRYVYTVYDFNGDGSLTHDEVLILLRSTLDTHSTAEKMDPEEFNDTLNALAAMTMKQFDISRRGAISFHDFTKVVHRFPLLLQSLGQCLPEEKKVKTFFALMTENYENYARNYSLPKESDYPLERLRYMTYAVQEEGKKKAQFGPRTLRSASRVIHNAQQFIKASLQEVQKANLALAPRILSEQEKQRLILVKPIKSVQPHETLEEQIISKSKIRNIENMM